SPEYGFEMTLPSDGWREFKLKDGRPKFVHRIPMMQVGIQSVGKQPMQADYLAAVERFKGYANEMSKKTGTPVIHREGKNRHQHPYYCFSAVEHSQEKQAVFVMGSMVWCEDKGIVVQLMFEGVFKMRSDTGHEAERQTFEKSAKAITQSVK